MKRVVVRQQPMSAAWTSYGKNLATLLGVLGTVCLSLSAYGDIVINEVMYHPPDDSDDLQFVELCNTQERPVDVGGWRFTDGVKFEFPPQTVLAGNSFGILVKNEDAVRSHYGDSANILGAFNGRLSHSGETLRLQDAAGTLVDEVVYEDRAPWPLGPDGYATSLERIFPRGSGSDPFNWAGAKMPDGKRAAGSPGRKNNHYSPVPLPWVESLSFEPEWPVPDETVRLSVALGYEGEIAKVTARYWRAKTGGETRPKELPMMLSGSKATVVLPEQEGDTLVRVQIVVTGKGGATRVFPSPDAPRPAASYFVADPPARAKIGQGWLVNVTGIERGVGKFDSPNGEGRRAEPARGQSALVYFPPDQGDPSLFDYVRATQRHGGFKIRFHADERFDDVSVMNVLSEGPSRYALSEYLSFELFRRAGVPSPKSGHIRFNIDGRPLGYYLTVEQPNRGFLRRNERETGGNLYKILWFGRGVVGQHEKKTNRHEGHDDIVNTVASLGRLQGAAQWRYIQQHFNVAEFANYYAVNMCLSNWDGFFNNYFVYHDVRSSEKWEIYPWDEDKTWGDYDGGPSDFSWYSLPLTSGMAGDRSPGGLFGGFRRGPFGGASWWRPPGYFSGPLLANPDFRKVFLARLEELCHREFTEPRFMPVIDALEARLLPEVRFRAQIRRRSVQQAEQEFRDQIDSFRRQLKHRRSFILRELASQ